MLKKDAAAHVYDVYAASWMVVMVYGWCSFGMFGDLWTYFNYERLHSFVCVGMAQTRHLHPSWETTRFVDLVALAICATMMGQLGRFAVWWFVLAQNVGHLSLVCGAKGSGGHVSLDTFASQPEESWFDPALHETSIENFLETWGGLVGNKKNNNMFRSL